jgi:hypothetical protein
MIEKFQGPGRLEMNEASFMPYNFYYEWMSLVRPQVAFQNPRVRIRSKKPEVNALQAIALQFYVNRWIRDTHYVRTIERATTHMGFTHGTTMTTLDAYYGDFDDPRSRPRKLVLDPMQYGMDALARSWEETRIMFHRCVESKAQLLERAEKEDGWNMDAVRKLATSVETDSIGRPKSEVDRGEVCYWWCWLPGNEPDESTTHGRTVVLGVQQGTDGQQKATFLRDWQDYYGPRWGPYTLWDFYYVPRSAWPMGPLQAQEGLVRYLNAQAKVNLRRAKNRKEVMVFDETDTKNAEMLLNAPDGSGIGISQFEKSKFERIELGGVNEDELAYEQWLDQLLKRGSGISDAELGNSRSGQTATSDTIAAAGSSARKGFLEQKVYDAVRRDLTTIAYFGWTEETVVEPLGQEFKQELARMGVPGEFLANLNAISLEWRGGEKTPFDDLELEIEPYSMNRVDEGAERAETLQVFQLLSNVAPLIPQTPWMPWKQMLNRLGERFHLDRLGEEVDTDMAYQIGAAMFQLEQMAAQPSGGGAGKSQGPRMSGDVGGSPSPGPSRMARPSELGKGSGSLPGYNSGAKIGAQVRE